MARGSISNTTAIVDRATDVAAPENMEPDTLQTPDSAPTPQKDEIGQRGVEAALAMEEERVRESTTDTEGERPHVVGRRRTFSYENAPTSLEGLEDSMETPQEEQPVRRQHGNEQSGQMDVEGALGSGV